jgi:putative peptide zinc metalloprotease protein
MDRAVMAAPAGSKQAPSGDALPALRQDLMLRAGPLDHDGRATWQIYDPLRHRFIAINRATFVTLSVWSGQSTLSGLASAASNALGETLAVATIADLGRFLGQNGLLAQPANADWRAQAKAAKRHGLLMTLVHNYLFFKIPLFAPDALLSRTAWIVAPLFSRTAIGLIAALGLIGLFLASRQWDMFLHHVAVLISPTGLVQFGGVLFLIKILHEFAHAYAAHRYGCRVPVIGLAFMMMAPMLYTDVTDAWRLQNRRQRLIIDGAGVACELGLACIATFLWVFLPDGNMRQIALLVATTSWIMSVAINLNPLMRFDGYYMFSDFLQIDNLQGRAFAFGQWRLRRVLFGLAAPAPEALDRGRQWLLTIYAWSIWLYRLVLFTGIAVAVYVYFFKALGIALFIFEIGYFIVRPVVAEFRQWWLNRREIMVTRRTYLTAATCVAGLLLFFVPWSTTVTVPAVLEAADVARLHAPRAARITEVMVAAGQPVQKGAAILKLDAPDLDFEQQTVAAKLAVVTLRLERLAADKEDRDDKQVLDSQRAALVSKLKGLAAEREELVIRAPLEGIVAELNPVLHAGRWLGTREPIALVRAAGRVTINGYVAEADLWRIDPGAKGRFIADMPFAPSVAAVLSVVAIGSARYIEVAELAAVNGGRIDAHADGRQRLVPRGAQYGVSFTVDGPIPDQAVRQRGLVHVAGRPESYFAALWRQVLKVVVREAAA